MVGRSERWRTAGWVWPWILMLVSCQSTTSYVGDQYYEEGDLADAEAAFVKYLGSDSVNADTASRALYRLGVIYATPRSSLYDPDRSIEVLEELVTTYPESPFSPEAMLVRGLLLQARDLNLAREQAESHLAELEIELAAHQAEVFTLQKEMGVREGRITQLEASIPPLEAQIRDLTEQLRAKESELEQLDRLKAIDLESPPPRKKH